MESNFGVLTGASCHYFQCLKLMVHSLNEQGIPLTVLDDGLNGEQIQWLEGKDVVVDDGTSGIVAERFFFNPNNPQIIYEKPFKCLKSPYEKTVWIDADAIPLKDTMLFFDLLDKNEAFFTKDYYSEQSVSDQLMRELRAPNAEEIDLHFNSGVFGWNSTCEAIELWASVSHYVSTVPELRVLPRCCDQDMLCYAVHALEMDDLILDGIEYNTPANFYKDEDAEQRKSYEGEDFELLEKIGEDHPSSLVVHWMGLPKLDHLVL
jgi:hypothetical protein